MRNYPSVGVQVADIYLPAPGVDPSRWAVIACDQFTSQPEYWQNVRNLVGEAPSTFKIILPEVFLGKPEEKSLIQSTQKTMQEYLEKGVLQPREGLIFVERTVDGKTRRGLMLALDLEKYDYNKGSQTLIRASEGTIVDRLPPRMRIREGAAIEAPHILVLIDDPEKTVIEPLQKMTAGMEKIYDFDLMLGSGHLTGYFVNDLKVEERVMAALEKLAGPALFQKKYGVGADKGVLLYAMGDGNHSLATAKAIWEQIKPTVGMNHPARFALIELENVHDEGLEFEPIHRVLFELKRDVIKDMQAAFGTDFSIHPCASRQEMVNRVNKAPAGVHAIGCIQKGAFQVIEIRHPKTNLPVGTLQDFLDKWVKEGGAESLDYVHGEDVVCDLGSQPGNAGFYLPGMQKSDLFKTVILDGALPRKTFSMGEAHEKRFYMECRKIKP